MKIVVILVYYVWFVAKTLYQWALNHVIYIHINLTHTRIMRVFSELDPHFLLEEVLPANMKEAAPYHG